MFDIWYLRMLSGTMGHVYAPINGLPQDGRGGGGSNDLQGGKFDSTAILKIWEDLGMSDKWWAILKNTENSFEQVAMANDGWTKGKEYWVAKTEPC